MGWWAQRGEIPDDLPDTPTRRKIRERMADDPVIRAVEFQADFNYRLRKPFVILGSAFCLLGVVLITIDALA